MKLWTGRFHKELDKKQTTLTLPFGLTAVWQRKTSKEALPMQPCWGRGVIDQKGIGADLCGP